MEQVAHIGHRLRSLMDDKGFTAIDLARRADVKPTFLYDILNGKSQNPSAVRLAKVAEALGVSLSRLMHSDIYQTTAPGYALVHTLQDAPSFEGSTVVPFTTVRREPHYFRESWLRDRLNADAAGLRVFYIQSDCMAPMLNPRDLVLLDITQTHPSPPGIFVLLEHGALVAKRLEYASPRADTIRVLCDNPAYTPGEYPAGTLRIVGRILWFSREI